MKKLMLVAVLLASSLPHLFGSSKNLEAQELLVTAQRRASLFRDQPNPFQLDVDFIAQVNTALQGHLTLKWEAKDRWWRKIVMGDFQQIEIRSGERQYTSRNLSFTPARIGELD